MVDGTNLKKDKESIDRYLARLEAEKPIQVKSKGCDWCGKNVPKSCKTVKEYADCKNNK